jgi:hypothetical protein
MSAGSAVTSGSNTETVTGLVDSTVVIVKGMAKTYVLDRVAADLARGFTHPAIQRLSSLVATYPTDLDLRRRLAAVHRRVGNRIQAGRWDYLTIGADTEDTSAFERAFPSAANRLREVRWPHRASLTATAYARTRLERLVAAAEAERAARAAGRTARRAARAGQRRGTVAARLRWMVAWVPRSIRRWNPPRLVVAVSGCAAALLVGLGAFTVIESAVRWIIH